MSQVLYRKYRSKSFSDLLGQEHIKKTLQYSIKNHKVAHAYIFSGPRGTGKTSTARIFARAVNCLASKDGNPCNECPNCKSIINNSALDIIEIDAASNRGIEEIRELKERVNFAPANLTYKVYIIDEVHMLTKEAFNALLKTLEEPPSHIIFILATTEIEKVPITILSRSQRFDFKLASQDEISQKVKLILEGESRTMADEAISLLVELGRGSFRDTETILEKILNTLENPKKEIGLENIEEVLGIASYSQIEELAEAISNKSQVKVFGIVKSIEESGINPKYVINQLLENFRKRLLRRVIEKSGDLSASELAFIVSAFVEAFSQIRFSPIEILPLEVALVNIFDKIGTSTDIISVSKPEKEISSPKEFKQKIKSTKEVLPEREESEEQKNSDKKSEISVFELKSKWEDLLNEIKPYNHHLVAFLSKAEPLSVENNSIQIKVAYKFHKDRIENQKSKDAINKVTGIVYGKEYSFECILDENMKSTEMKDGFSEDTNEELVEEIFKE